MYFIIASWFFTICFRFFFAAQQLATAVAERWTHYREQNVRARVHNQQNITSTTTTAATTTTTTTSESDWLEFAELLISSEMCVHVCVGLWRHLYNTTTIVVVAGVLGVGVGGGVGVGSGTLFVVAR